MLDTVNGDAIQSTAHEAGEGEDMPQPLATRVEAVAAIAARHAEAVDRDGRFPDEAFSAIRQHKLLSVMVPRSFGGEEASISTVVDLCYRLGRACASTAMIYAMHQTKVACVIGHHGHNAWQTGLLRRLARDELLFASSTTEGQNGGNIRSTAAPILHEGEVITFERAATVMSYGAQADAIVTTARRGEDTSSSDQVLAVFLKEDYTLEQSGGWNTLGMRGTCSAGFALKARGSADQILPVAYETIHSETMTPVAHLVWSAVWAGIAAAAVEKAQLFIRKAARQSGGQLPPGAAHFTKAGATLNVLRNLIGGSARRYQDACSQPDILRSMEFQTAITLLKVDASEMAVAIVMSALRACGLSGYRNDGEVSIGRHLRDVLSSPLMINNDRILSNLATAALMSPVPASLAA